MNVVVRVAPNAADTAVIDAMNPEVMVQVADQPGLREVADAKLHAAIAHSVIPAQTSEGWVCRA